MAEGGKIIINVSSSTTALMLPGYAAYVATKGAVEPSPAPVYVQPAPIPVQP